MHTDGNWSVIFENVEFITSRHELPVERSLEHVDVVNDRKHTYSFKAKKDGWVLVLERFQYINDDGLFDKYSSQGARAKAFFTVEVFDKVDLSTMNVSEYEKATTSDGIKFCIITIS